VILADVVIVQLRGIVAKCGNVCTRWWTWRDIGQETTELTSLLHSRVGYQASSGMTRGAQSEALSRQGPNSVVAP
jgi:hypothetical protein